LVAVPAFAQIPTPVSAGSGVIFTNTDHLATNLDGTPVVASYELRFLTSQAGCAAVASVNLGKPALDAGGAVVVKPVAQLGALQANCIYTAVVASISATGPLAVSGPSNPFARVVAKIPAASSPPVIQP
jgi:hypothetical protein